MNRYLGLLLIISLLVGCQQKPQKTEHLQAKNKLSQEEVDTVIDSWLKLWATYDLDLLEKIFYKSEDLSYFSSEKEGLIKGYDQMLPHHQGFGFTAGGKTPEKALWMEEIESILLDGSAVVTAVWYFGDKSMAKDSLQRGPVTFVLSKDKANEAKILHTHFANY